MQNNHNQHIISRFSNEDQDLLDSIENLINSGNYIEAIEHIKFRLTQQFSYDSYENDFFNLELSMLMIDAGSEGKIKEAVLLGEKLLENNYKTSKIMREGDYHFNMGNVKDALFNITTQEKYENIPDNISHLIEAKDHYWSSLKYYQDNKQEPLIQLYVNLGNVLYSCYRLTEAIQFYDLALKLNPEFPQANLNRSRCLIFLNMVTETLTPNQIMQAVEGFKTALKSEFLPSNWSEFAKGMIIRLTQNLKDLNLNIKEYEHEKLETEIESLLHSDYRNFCIEKKISLNEHSIYCNCAGSKYDDLSISSKKVAGEFIPKMELVLNRIKSEFIFARWLYFESQTSETKIENIINKDVRFTELFDNEYVGASSEMLRTSFKICFGILDRIATGICNLFNLSTPKESVSFHNFWKKNPKMWDKIKLIENPFIIALYTLASDLNKNGQLNQYKNWRDDIEHNILFLSFEPNNKSFFFEENGTEESIFKYVDANKFTKSLEHLLHLVASAIFNFVYCVRYEGLKYSTMNGSPPIILKPKLNSDLGMFE